MRERPSDHRRALWLFVLLAAYIVAQSAWWAWLVVSKDREMEQLIAAFQLRPEGYPAVHASRTLWMVAGEGSVFLLLLLVALWVVYRSVRHELDRARQQRDLLMAVGHELRTPVAGMKLHLQTLERPDLSPEERTLLERRAIDDASRLGDLTERILLATQMDGSPVHLNISIQPLDPLIERSVQRARGTYARADALEVIGGGRQAMIDPAAFTSVLDNLLENAVKHGPEKGVIQVGTREEAGRVVLFVMDRGPGIPAADRQRIFQKFQRGERAIKDQVKGTGLGLFIVDRLMRRMHGTIGVTAREGGGSIFAASFPAR
jgi:signal transduction histidine kinase